MNQTLASPADLHDIRLWPDREALRESGFTVAAPAVMDRVEGWTQSSSATAVSNEALPQTPPVLSVVVPVFNESENVVPLAMEISASLESLGERIEIIFVDDASTDDTVSILKSLEIPGLRVVRHRCNAGQSAAVASGFQHATADWVATLDGDGQNDPSDLPAMYELARKERVDCVTGVRARRRDTWVKRISSKIANRVRNTITGDQVTDSGCGIRIIRRTSLREITVFNGMHRFLPTLLRRQGFSVKEHVVNHRERTRGVSKYGVHNRLWRGLRDCFGVRWYLQRAVPADRLYQEIP